MTALVAQPKHKRDLNARHLARVRELPCCARELGECEGSIEAHHKTGAGLGVKASDTDTFALCRKHHSELHRVAGAFRGWVKRKLRSWQEKMVRETKAVLLPPVRKVF